MQRYQLEWSSLQGPGAIPPRGGDLGSPWARPGLVFAILVDGISRITPFTFIWGRIWGETPGRTPDYPTRVLTTPHSQKGTTKPKERGGQTRRIGICETLIARGAVAIVPLIRYRRIRFFFAFFARASMLPALLSRSAALAASWHRVCRHSVAFRRDQMCHAVHRRVHGVHRRCTFVHHMLARLSR